VGSGLLLDCVPGPRQDAENVRIEQHSADRREQPPMARSGVSVSTPAGSGVGRLFGCVLSLRASGSWCAASWNWASASLVSFTAASF